MASMMMDMDFFFNNSSSISTAAAGASESLPTPGESSEAPSMTGNDTAAPSAVIAVAPGHSRPPNMPLGSSSRAPPPTQRHTGNGSGSPTAESASLTAPGLSPALRGGRAGSSSSSSTVLVAHNKDYELERKRARDRRSQQAMRDRNKWTIQTLNQQLSQLSAALDEQAYAASTLGDRVKQLESENAHLRAQQSGAVLASVGAAVMPATPTNTITTVSTPAGAAPPSSPQSHHSQPYQGHQLRYPATRSMYMSESPAPGPVHYSDFLLATKCLEPWEMPPFNCPHTCIADEIVQGFIATERRNYQASPPPPQSAQPPHSCSPFASDASTRPIVSPSGPLPPLSASSPTLPSPSRIESHPPSAAHRRKRQTQLRPNPAGLIYKDHQSDDEISNMVGGIIRSYNEIETLPKQVSVFFTMTVLVKWLVSLDAATWGALPAWLRPLPCQLQTPHAAWVDRIPWPRARRWLVSHPEVTLDIFAATYSSSLTILWDFSHDHVLVKIEDDSPTIKGKVVLNPIFEQHIRQLKYWSVGEPFRTKFAELAELIDQDRRDWA